MKTKKHFHKLTAWLLTLAMLMTLMPSFTLSAFAEESYSLWVGGKQFTSEMLEISDGNGGTATYDLEENTLTLNNYAYTGAGYTWESSGYNYGAAIYYGGSDTLKLVLNGTSSVTQQSATELGISKGIYSTGSITVYGTGSLNAIGSAARNHSYGVHADGAITIEGGNLSGSGDTTDNGSEGVSAGSITVLGGSLSGTGGDSPTGSSHGVNAGSITVSGGSLTGTSGKALFDSISMAFTSAPVIADTLVVYNASGAVIENPNWDALKYAKIAALELPPGTVASVTTAYGETTFYTGINDAIKTAQENDGSTLKLLDNITTDNYVEIDSGSFTIDLGGKTWQSSTHVMHICGTANVTITDSSTDRTGKLWVTKANTTAIFLDDTAVLTLCSGTIEGTNHAVSLSDLGSNPSQAQFVMHDGTVKADVTAILTIGSSVKINGGTIDGEIGYLTGEIDLSGHSDPAGILIYTGGSLPENPTIKLPKSYVLLERDSGSVVTTITEGMDYIVGKCDHGGENVTYENGFCVCCGYYEPVVQNGDNVYEISNGGQLFWFAELVNNDTTGAFFNAVLTEDIDLEEREWTPIGYEDYPYSGHFNGKGHTVSGLLVTTESSTDKDAGLFGCIKGAGIRNLSVDGRVEYAPSNDSIGVGLLVGVITDSIVYNCYTSGSISETGLQISRTGGLVGLAEHSVIINCGSEADVMSANGYLGGLVGYMTAGYDDPLCLLNSYSTGNVVGGSEDTGGLVGWLADDAVNNYFSGTVKSDNASALGVLFGYVSNSITIDGSSTTFEPVIEKNYYTSGSGNPIGRTGGGLDSAGYTQTYSSPEELLNELNSNLGIIEEIIAGHRGYLEESQWAKLVELLDGDSVTASRWRLVDGKVVHCSDTDEDADRIIVLGTENGDGTYSLPENVVGYYIDEDFVDAGKYVVSGGEVITTVYFNVTMLNGAQVRYGGGLDENGKISTGNGLRFLATVDRSNFEGEGYGMKITAEGSDNETIVEATKWQDDTTFSVAITDMAESNYIRKFTATPFVKVKYADGSEKTIYGTQTVTRSIYQTAAGLLKDETQNAYGLVDVLNAYANQTGIRLVVKDGELKANTSYTAKGAYCLTEDELHFAVSDAAYDKAGNKYSVILTAQGNAEIITDNDFWYEYIRINNNNSLVKDKVTVERVPDNDKAVKVTFKADGLIERPADANDNTTPDDNDDDFDSETEDFN